LLALAAYRVFSKDMTRRISENRKFLSIWNPLAARFKDRKTHKYYKCPSCSQQLRVPKKKGNLSIKCPKCGTEFKGRT
jgi:DNA-directed RNA polymerase subunit RPC12/RpoP